MINITSLSVRSLDLDHFDLFWEIAPVTAPRNDTTPHQIFDYDFYVLRSVDGAMGPFEQVAGPLRDQYMIRDVGVSTLHTWRQYFYKIRVTHRPTGESREFGPVASQEQPPDLIAAEIVRLEDIALREVSGRKCWLFKARTFGPLCSCFDPVLGRKLIGNHKPCFGTGFLGGYLPPIETYVQIDPVGTRSQSNSVQETTSRDTTARLVAFPPVSPRDILVEAENIRWRVLSVGGTERLRSKVHQEVQLHEIPRGDVEYDLPLNVDLRKLQAAAQRNFTNPQNLGSNDDFSDIFATYSGPRGVSR